MGAPQATPARRVLLFLCALLVAPALVALGDAVHAELLAWAVAGGLIAASAAWARAANRRAEGRPAGRPGS